MLIHVLIRLALETLTAPFMLLAKPPAEPRRGIPINEPIGGCNPAKAEIIGPSPKFTIQSGYHFFGIEPSHISASLEMYRFDHALDTLL